MINKVKAEGREICKTKLRQMCIDNNLYTKGNNEEYDNMFDMATRYYPSTEHIYEIAKDIKEHSENQTIENIMFLIANYAITYYFQVEE